MSCCSYVNNTAGVFIRTPTQKGKQIVFFFFHHFVLFQLLETKNERVFPFQVAIIKHPTTTVPLHLQFE